MIRFIFSILPTRFLSKIAGFFANLSFPKFLVRIWIFIFTKIYNIDLKEFEKESIKDYKTFNEFFTRRLKHYDFQEGFFISPVCGRVIDAGRFYEKYKFHAKGSIYTIDDFLPKNFKGFRNYKSFAIIYLSPRDYHRIHFPATGKIEGIFYRSGRLFPVNDWGVHNVKRLFAKNERVSIEIKTKKEKILLALIGAFLVGSIKIDFLDDELKASLRKKRALDLSDKNFSFEKGDLLGSFQFGSTVIAFFEKDHSSILEDFINRRLRVGEKIL